MAAYTRRGWTNYKCPNKPPERVFVPQDHQTRVMEEFLTSDKRGLILYHQLGSGKCVHGSTEVYINGQKEKLTDLWLRTPQEVTKDDEGGEWKTPLDLSTLTLPYTEEVMSNGDKIADPFDTNGELTVSRKILKLYREYLEDDILKEVYFSNGISLLLTMKHKLLCKRGHTYMYTNNLSKGMTILTRDGKEVTISSIYYFSYSGYVYDLEVDETHAYLANDIASHNTCSAINCIDNYLKKKGKNIPVHIFLPASLKKNFVTEYCSYCGADRESLPKFMFYSFNWREMARYLPTNLNKSIIVVDEVHVVINGARNKSETYLKLYNLILNSKRSKILLLTGTPIYGSPFDAALLTNLIKPGELATDPLEFFAHQMKNPSLLAKAFSGIISYVPVSLPERYPYSVDVPIYMARMSQYQYAGYEIDFMAEEKKIKPTEEEIRKALAMSKKKAAKLKGISYMLVVRIKSRQKCNIVYPDERQTEITQSTARSHISDKNYNVTSTFIENLSTYSDKIFTMMKRVICLPGKHYIYSMFKTHYGVYLIASILRYYKIPYVTYTGDNSKNEREKNKIAFNAPDNNMGQKIRVILLTGAGAMGITLLGSVHCHILEADLNEFLIKQVEGRGFRLDSQRDLPENMRFFMIHRYISVGPKGQPTTELAVYERAKEKYKEALPMLEIMKESAIDCKSRYGLGATNPSICRNIPDDEKKGEDEVDINDPNLYATESDDEKDENIPRLLADIVPIDAGAEDAFKEEEDDEFEESMSQVLQTADKENEGDEPVDDIIEFDMVEDEVLNLVGPGFLRPGT